MLKRKLVSQKVKKMSKKCLFSGVKIVRFSKLDESFVLKTIFLMASNNVWLFGKVSQISKNVGEMGLVHHGKMVFTWAKFWEDLKSYFKNIFFRKNFLGWWLGLLAMVSSTMSNLHNFDWSRIVKVTKQNWIESQEIWAI